MTIKSDQIIATENTTTFLASNFLAAFWKEEKILENFKKIQVGEM